MAAQGLTLDTGALLAAERRDRRFTKRIAVALARGARITLPAVVLAQAWRGNSPILALLIRSCVVEPYDEPRARRAGELLAKSRTADVVDATVALGAVLRGDTILTSDREDLARLVAAAGAPDTLIMAV